MRKPRHTVYAPLEEDGVVGVRATSECAASAIYLPVAGVDLTRTPRLAWRWRIERGLEVADERTRRGDDFAARVYVTFRFDPERAPFAERLRYRLARALYGERVWGRALVYAWTSHELAGARWDSPVAAGAKMISLGCGPLPAWATAEVDVAADFAAAFADAPPPLQAVALMTDSDDTCSGATADFADLRFVGP